MDKLFRTRKKKKIVRRKNPELEAIRRKRKIRNYSNSLSLFRSKFPIIKKLISATFALFIVVFLASFFLKNDYYSIKKVEAYGNNRISNDQLDISLEKFKDRNLIGITKNEVFIELKKDFLELGNINLVKEYPDFLKVEIIETLPAIVYFDLDSTELISSEGESVGQISFPAAELADTEKIIASTGGDPDGDYVRDRLQSQSEGAFKWDDISQEQRLETLNVLKSEVDFKLNQYLDQASENILNTSFKDLLILYKKEFGQETVKKDIITFSLDISENIKEKGLKINRVNVVNRFDLTYELEDNKKIILTVRRDVQDQLTDLNAIIFNGQFSEGSIFDLRSINYSIR